MTEVAAIPAPGKSVDASDFAEFTALAVTSIRWAADGRIVVAFDGDLDDDTAARVRRRLMSADATEEALRTSLADAAATTGAWSPPVKPACDLAAQVRALTEQITVLTRLVTGDSSNEREASQ